MQILQIESYILTCQRNGMTNEIKEYIKLANQLIQMGNNYLQIKVSRTIILETKGLYKQSNIWFRAVQYY